MSAEYVADRSLLRHLWREYPEWSLRDYARTTGRSLSWVKTWLRRFRTDPDNPEVIWGSPASICRTGRISGRSHRTDSRHSG